MDSPKQRKLVVIGNGMAGIAAVEAILKIRPEISITIFGDEPHTNYNRILLSDVLSGKTTPEKIILNPREWYDKHGIDLRVSTRVVRIDPAAKRVTDDKGTGASYDSLLLAVGGAPFVPPIPGREKKGVFVFRTMEETEHIIAAARSGQRAVVIGGGLLGLEAARGLINYGVPVTVVHLADRLMERQLDPIGASLLRREIERMGIRVLLNTTAEEIGGEGSVRSVRLTNGEELPAGMVLICAGIRPNLTLAKAAGLKIHQGVIVDDRMETSAPGIFAVGDVIEHRGKTYGLVAPIRDQAAVVSDAIVGEGKRRFTGALCATTLKVAGVHLTSAGDFTGGIGAEDLVFVDTEKGIYKKCVIQRNRLVGTILLGDNKDGARFFNLIQKEEDISAIKATLLGNVSVGAPAGGAAQLAESDLVCNCNSVTKGAIVCAILEKGLKSREEVAACTQATTGCGSCAQLVDDLLSATNKTPAAPSAVPLEVKTGAAGLKSLDLEKIKQEGLGIDWRRVREEGTRALTPEDYYRLKTYGICSQKHTGYFMLRIRIPGGDVTSRQLAALAELAETHGRGRAHLTVRQDLELHWVRVEDALDIFETLESVGLGTRSACGHTMRNVMACPHGETAADGLIDVRPWAKEVSDYFVSRSDLINPVMPNRINIYFAGCSACAPDAVINDIAFVAVRSIEGERPSPSVEQSPTEPPPPYARIGSLDKIFGRRSAFTSAPGKVGFELWVGGSLGAHPILGFKLREFIPLEEALPAAQAIFAIHTKFGNRNKAKSRLKYLIEQWGQERFVATFEKIFLEKKNLPENGTVKTKPTSDRSKQSIAPSIALARFGPPRNAFRERPSIWRRAMTAALSPISSLYPDPSPGVFPQRQRGYRRLTVSIPLGDVRTEQLAALGKIARRFGVGRISFTREQNVEIPWVPIGKLRPLVRALRSAGLELRGEERLRVLACPGTEFCALAVTNAQGAARDLLKHFQPDHPEKAALLRSISIHISGCPNSCAKHQVADIGLAGTLAPLGDSRRFSYQLYLGGQMEGSVRLGEMVRKGITEEMVLPLVDLLLDIVLEHRLPGETFQATVDHLGASKVAALLERTLGPHAPEAPHPEKMLTDLLEAPR